MSEQTRLPSEDEQFDKGAVLSMSAQLRPRIEELRFLERLELCGLWALMECVELHLSDEDIADMFDAMKERMMKQTETFRAGLEVAKGIGSFA